MASPQTWTLRFKHHKTTVLLHSDPLTPISTLKTNLLSSLRDTKPSGIKSRPIPISPSEIQLAIPVDPLEISKGWEILEPPSNIDEEDEQTPEAKQKWDESTSVKAAGVKDNAVIAFRWRIEAEEEDETDETEGTWDVVWPSFEDGYHVENEGDKGVHEVPRDFKD